MAFSNYKSISTVIKKFQIKYIQANFMLEVEFPVKDSFREELDLLFTDGVVDNSEDAICENLIYPVLKEVWKPYRHKLTLWSHETLIYDEDLSGVPDYIVTQRNPLGTIIFDKPYFLTVEAKQDKFAEGWGQCLAEMIAVQRINDNFDDDVFGIVSNGKVWQFGREHPKCLKTYFVIASVMKWSEAIAKSRYCDCFIPLRYIRNDKLNLGKF